MAVAGCVPGGAIETKRLKEISAKESKDEGEWGGLHSIPLKMGCRGGWQGACCFWVLAACKEPDPVAAGGGQSGPEHGNGMSGFALAYCSLASPPNVFGIGSVHTTRGQERASAELSAALDRVRSP